MSWKSSVHFVPIFQFSVHFTPIVQFQVLCPVTTILDSAVVEIIRKYLLSSYHTEVGTRENQEEKDHH